MECLGGCGLVGGTYCLTVPGVVFLEVFIQGLYLGMVDRCDNSTLVRGIRGMDVSDEFKSGGIGSRDGDRVLVWDCRIVDLSIYLSRYPRAIQLYPWTCSSVTNK